MNPNLSRREVQVLRAAAGGMTAHETGEWLGLSDSAVNLYVQRACMKLQANSKAHAVTIAMHKGYIG